MPRRGRQYIQGLQQLLQPIISARPSAGSRPPNSASDVTRVWRQTTPLVIKFLILFKFPRVQAMGPTGRGVQRTRFGQPVSEQPSRSVQWSSTNSLGKYDLASGGTFGTTFGDIFCRNNNADGTPNTAGAILTTNVDGTKSRPALSAPQPAAHGGLVSPRAAVPRAMTFRA